MLQRDIEPRQNWQERLCELGFDFYEVSSQHPYWTDHQYFQLNQAQIEQIDSVTEELHQLTITAIEYVFEHDLLHLFGLPERHHALLRHSWETDKTYLYGRFDFAWNGKDAPKMLEYNAQTPTSLFEASVAAWDWLKQNVDAGRLPSQADQFNILDEQLIVQFSLLKTTKTPQSPVLHFACDETSSEDMRTVTYMAACAEEAGWEAVIVDINAIQLTDDERFADHNSKLINNLFSLYPYEFALLDEYSDYLACSNCTFIEPLWKVLLSSKALLPILWQLNPGHRNLLECYFADDPRAENLTNKVIKPIFSREGANIGIYCHGEQVAGTSGNYGREGFICQQYAPLASFNGSHCVIGSWVIGQVGAGISFRLSDNLITNDVARFVPHLILN